ncbi:MAG: twin-arginine translocation signal domain-containing protein [Isosphaeraceae bacterium]
MSTQRTATRREFLRYAAATAAAVAGPNAPGLALGQERGQRPPKADGVEVLHPLGRTPVSFIIDDSTCLVNLAHFAIPQFAQVSPTSTASPGKNFPARSPTDSSDVRRVVSASTA